MALRATEQGSRPLPSAADTDPDRRPLAPGGMGCSKRAAVAGLPDDAVVEILARLPAKFLCRSKCVSKAWCDLIADRLRCRKLPLTLEGFFYGCEYKSRDEGCCHTFSDSGDGSGSESNDEGGSEDDKEGSSEDDKEGGSENNSKDGSDDGDECGSEDGDKCGSEDDDECGSENDDEGGSEDDDEGGSGEDKEGGSEDGDECSECKDGKSSHQGCGHFINLLGRSVPLVDPLFSRLRKQPKIKNLTLIDSCNGLLLFGQTWCSPFGDTTSYIVYNPATEHWVPVPSSGFSSNPLEHEEDSDEDVGESCVLTCLIFDPVISSHFQLIEFCHNSEVALVHSYSSQSKGWGNRDWRQWKKGGEWDLHRTITSMRGTTIFNKMLHLIVSPSSTGPELIAAIDGEGKTRKVIHWGENHGFPVFVGQSKGLLHCLSVSGHPDGNSCQMTELSVWVLEDYDAEEWSLKHIVSFSELFGKKSCQFASDYNVVAIHPDQNLVFFVKHWDYELISYDMDRKEVRALRTVGCYYGVITPYVPFFSETPVLTKRTGIC